MIKEIITPKHNKIQIEIPDEFVNEELEILVFPTKETIRQSENGELLKSMKDLFENASTVKVDEDIDIDSLMPSMNDALS